MKNKKVNLKSNWNSLKEKIKRQYADMIDNDLLFNEGQDDLSFTNFYKTILRGKSFAKVSSPG